MNRKPKQCKRCNQEKQIWARGMCLDCDRIETPEKHGLKFKTKPKKMIAGISKKHQNRLTKYIKIRETFMKEHPMCECGMGCGLPSTDVHHMKGKIGDLLFDTRFFKALNRICHTWVETHPKEAKELGLSENRL